MDQSPVEILRDQVANPPPPVQAQNIHELPVEILDEVANNLVRYRDIASAALVNRRWNSSFGLVLYRNIEVGSTSRDVGKFRTLPRKVVMLASVLNK